MITAYLTMAVLLTAFPVQTVAGDADSVITLEYCYRQVEEQYPTADKSEFREKITELNKKIAQSGTYPRVTFSGMASYQSDVTEVTFTAPGTTGPQFSKDHYKVSLDLAQPIYNGGAAEARKSLEAAGGVMEQFSIEVEMHKLRERVDEVYFGALLLGRRMESTGLLLSDLRRQLKVVETGVQNGVLLSSQASILRAEILKAEQDSIQLAADRMGALDVLGIMTGLELHGDITLEVPEALQVAAGETVPEWRPEYRLFEASRMLLEKQSTLSFTRKVPSISAFATTAYGRPGLNVFDDDLQAWYVIGLRVQWNFWDAINAGREQQVIRYREKIIEADKEAFTRGLSGSLSRLREQIAAMRQVIIRDEEIIALTRNVARESSSRLEQGIITATEYLSELNRLHRARLGKTIHDLELARIQNEYRTTIGEPLR